MCMFGNKYEEPSDRGKPMKVMHSFEHVINLFTLMKNPLFFSLFEFQFFRLLTRMKRQKKVKNKQSRREGGGGVGLRANNNDKVGTKLIK